MKDLWETPLSIRELCWLLVAVLGYLLLIVSMWSRDRPLSVLGQKIFDTLYTSNPVDMTLGNYGSTLVIAEKGLKFCDKAKYFIDPITGFNVRGHIFVDSRCLDARLTANDIKHIASIAALKRAEFLAYCANTNAAYADKRLGV